MTASKSMPSAAASRLSGADIPAPDQSELVDRLATEMRVKSGGELPLSFCIEQVRRELAAKLAVQTSTTAEPVLPPIPGTTTGRSVFHSWALPD